MNKTEILTFTQQVKSKSTRVLGSGETDFGDVLNGVDRWAYVAGMQSTLIDKLVEYIQTH